MSTLVGVVAIMGAAVVVCLAYYRARPRHARTAEPLADPAQTEERRRVAVALQEHDELSPDFLEWLREVGDLDHPEGCRYCTLNRYSGGLREGGGAYESALDCPYCGVQVRAAGMVEWRYADHLVDRHGLPYLRTRLKQSGLDGVPHTHTNGTQPVNAERPEGYCSSCTWVDDTRLCDLPGTRYLLSRPCEEHR